MWKSQSANLVLLTKLLHKPDLCQTLDGHLKMSTVSVKENNIISIIQTSLLNMWHLGYLIRHTVVGMWHDLPAIKWWECDMTYQLYSDRNVTWLTSHTVIGMWHDLPAIKWYECDMTYLAYSDRNVTWLPSHTVIGMWHDLVACSDRNVTWLTSHKVVGMWHDLPAIQWWECDMTYQP